MKTKYTQDEILENYTVGMYGDHLEMSDAFTKEDFRDRLGLGNEAKKILLEQAKMTAEKIVEDNIEFIVEDNVIAWRMPFCTKKEKPLKGEMKSDG